MCTSKILVRVFCAMNCVMHDIFLTLEVQICLLVSACPFRLPQQVKPFCLTSFLYSIAPADKLTCTVHVPSPSAMQLQSFKCFLPDFSLLRQGRG
jgi:hypothetical protein